MNRPMIDSSALGERASTQSMLRLGEPGLALMLPSPESGLREQHAERPWFSPGRRRPAAGTSVGELGRRPPAPTS